MRKASEDLLADIDSTLDQLICNVQAVDQAPFASLTKEELEALQKTQESLLARLMHAPTPAIDKRSSASRAIEQKVAEFGRLNSRFLRSFSRRFKTRRPKRQRVVACPPPDRGAEGVPPLRGAWNRVQDNPLPRRAK